MAYNVCHTKTEGQSTDSVTTNRDSLHSGKQGSLKQYIDLWDIPKEGGLMQQNSLLKLLPLDPPLSQSWNVTPNCSAMH